MTNSIFEKIVCIAKAVLKKCPLILCFAITVGVAADIVVSAAWVPEYKSTVSAVVENDNMSYSKLAETKSYIKTMEYIWNGHVAKEYVKKQVGCKDLELTCKVENKDDTNFVDISVTSDSIQHSYYALRSLIVWNNEISPIYKEDYYLKTLNEIEYVDVPIKENKHYINFFVGFLAGAIFLGAFYTLMEMLKKKARCEDDIKDNISCRIYVQIPKEQKKRGRRFWLPNKKGLLITSLKTSTIFKESFKKFRSRFEQSAKKHGYKSMMITSTMENEGKSTILVNLALALAMKDKKVLLIDYDIVKPAIHKLLQLENSGSLNKYLQGEGTVQDLVQKYKGYELYVLTTKSVRENPEEFLKEDKIEKLIKEAAADYDYVLVDTSPAGNINDALIINKYVDTSMIVIKQGVTTCSFIEETIERIKNSKDNLMGCVYNRSILDSRNKKRLQGYNKLEK